MSKSTYRKIQTILERASPEPTKYAKFLRAIRREKKFFVYYRKGDDDVIEKKDMSSESVLAHVRFCQSLGLVDYDDRTGLVRLTQDGQIGRRADSLPVVLSDAIVEYLRRNGVEIEQLKSAIQAIKLPDPDSLHDQLSENGTVSLAKPEFRRCLSLLAVAGADSGVVTIEAFQRKLYTVPESEHMGAR